MISKLALDCAFANELSSSPEFRLWLLDQTKFKDRSKQAILLHREQAKAKPQKNPKIGGAIGGVDWTMGGNQKQTYWHSGHAGR